MIAKVGQRLQFNEPESFGNIILQNLHPLPISHIPQPSYVDVFIPIRKNNWIGVLFSDLMYYDHHRWGLARETIQFIYTNYLYVVHSLALIVGLSDKMIWQHITSIFWGISLGSETCLNDLLIILMRVINCIWKFVAVLTRKTLITLCFHHFWTCLVYFFQLENYCFLHPLLLGW